MKNKKNLNPDQLFEMIRDQKAPFSMPEAMELMQNKASKGVFQNKNHTNFKYLLVLLITMMAILSFWFLNERTFVTSDILPENKSNKLIADTNAENENSPNELNNFAKKYDYNRNKINVKENLNTFSDFNSNNIKNNEPESEINKVFLIKLNKNKVNVIKDSTDQQIETLNNNLLNYQHYVNNLNNDNESVENVDEIIDEINKQINYENNYFNFNQNTLTERSETLKEQYKHQLKSNVILNNLSLNKITIEDEAILALLNIIRNEEGICEILLNSFMNCTQIGSSRFTISFSKHAKQIIAFDSENRPYIKTVHDYDKDHHPEFSGLTALFSSTVRPGNEKAEFKYMSYPDLTYFETSKSFILNTIYNSDQKVFELNSGARESIYQYINELNFLIPVFVPYTEAYLLNYKDELKTKLADSVQLIEEAKNNYLQYLHSELKDENKGITLWYLPTEELFEILPDSVSDKLLKEMGSVSKMINNQLKLQYSDKISEENEEEEKFNIEDPENNDDCIFFEACRNDTRIFHSTLIYPNPAKDKVNIKIKLSKERKLNIMLTDIQGRLIKHIAENQMVNGYFEIETEVGNLADGIYLIVFETDRLERNVQRLVIMR